MGTDLTFIPINSGRIWFARAACFAAVAAFAAGCSTPQPKAKLSSQESKEYFSEKEYGVKASPRVTHKSSRLKRGGGRNQIGKPYKVKGKWYYPKDVRSYSKVGKASWYGSAFHGRLTANGEVYDMTHLTAAHPTLPLPSYARVTNTANGNSVIVRINDRGPFAHGRIIDLSKRAAQLLDYTHSGIAKVKVDYIGRAPLHGQDDSYLVASYRPGGRAPDPSDGLASGVLVAMNDTTLASGSRRPPSIIGTGTVLPDSGPILPDRPSRVVVASLLNERIRPLAYTEKQRTGAQAALEMLATNDAMSSVDIVRSWKRQNGVDASQDEAVFVGTFADPNKARTLKTTLAHLGRVQSETSQNNNTSWTSVTVWPATGIAINDVLETAWSAGATDAMILRD